MMKWLFQNRTKETRKRQRLALSDEIVQDEKLTEELSGLVASGQPKKVNKALTEADTVLDNATQSDIRGNRLMAHGRCPQCHLRTENLLYTSVCPSCGWHRRHVPDSGSCVVHLTGGEIITCQQVFPVQNQQFLCVTDGVVRHQVMGSSIQRIDYEWAADELSALKERALKQIRGACSWCEQGLETSEERGPLVDYVAFGLNQERYIFCSQNCMRQFRSQFPPRVHRNCYEVECATCDSCLKRYDMTGFRRRVLA